MSFKHELVTTSRDKRYVRRSRHEHDRTSGRGEIAPVYGAPCHGRLTWTCAHL